MTGEAGSARRRSRTAETDHLLRTLFDDAVPAAAVDQFVLLAIGGYGRRELSPFSDIDVMLVHQDGSSAGEVEDVAAGLWYPLWDRGMDLDHSVRTVSQLRAVAGDDYRSAFGVLDARVVAGNEGLGRDLRSQVLHDWRRTARLRLADVRADREKRIERSGWLAFTAIPDLKDSGGGLRDGVVMRALVATWLVDVPHVEVESLRAQLLDVRDALHTAAGRRGDLLTPEMIADVADELGVEAGELDLHTRGLGRRLAFLDALAWRRLDDSLAKTQRRTRLRAGPRLDAVSPGVAIFDNEVVLTGDANIADAGLPMRAAVEAARRGLPLAERSVARMAKEMVVSPEPWPVSIRRLMVDLLASGPGLVTVWDQLDFAGVIERWLHEWPAIRLRGSASPVHRFTVDRHSVEACVEASLRARDVRRPDLLVVAALLHDLGKGRPGDHSEVGASIAAEVARRWGFNADDVYVIQALVRWHLLLSTTATRRDIDDPMTAANVAEIAGDLETLELLYVLTEADARATSATAWSPWRAGLIGHLTERTRDYFDESIVNPAPESYAGPPGQSSVGARADFGKRGFTLDVSPNQGGSAVEVVLPDRRGAMADIAAGLALAGIEIRSARAMTDGGVATSTWDVTRPDIDPTNLADRLRSVLDRTTDLESRLHLRALHDPVPTRVLILEGRSATASVIEVRTHDRRGLVWIVCRTIAELGHEIRSAHLSTFGTEARDVFYVVTGDGPLEKGPLEEMCGVIAGALA